LDKVPIPNREEVTPRKLKDEEISSLFEHSTKGVKLKDSRDKAIIALLCFEGLKVSELISLDWKHFLPHMNKGSLLIPGERRRLIILNPSTYKFLSEYHKIYHECRPMIPKTFKMFLGFKGREALSVSSKISRHGLKYMLYELGQLCEIPNLNTETLRHQAIQHHLNAGASPEDIMKHFGLRQLGNIAKHHKVKRDYDSRI
jgi:site-specific recombinase XerD